MKRITHSHGRCGRSRGTTLIELMVALGVGMVLCLAVFSVLAMYEGRKRTLNAGNDLEQSGQIAMYRLDGLVRSAGSGMASLGASAYGCPLRAAKSGTVLLPLDQSVAARMGQSGSSAAYALGLAPAFILPDATVPGDSGKPSDALVVMSTAANAGARTPFTSVPSNDTLNLQNSVDLLAGDLVLVGDGQTGDDGALRPCMVQQVASGFSTGAASAVPLGGPYHASVVGDTTLGLYSDSGFALRLGSATRSGPHFLVLAVGDHSVLYSYDLLAVSGQPLQAEAEGVFELHALYGVDTDGDGKVDRWVSASTSPYTAEALSAGTPAAASLLRQIKALRIGLFLRTSLPERDEVTLQPLVLFGDLDPALHITRELSTQERHYRYRTLEETVPVRNNLLATAP